MNNRKLTYIVLSSFVVILILVLSYKYFTKETLPPITYRIAIDETWYPLQLFDKEQDITVFSEKITEEIAKRQHFSIQLLEVESGSLFAGLDTKEYEAVLSSLLVLEADPEDYVFSDPYYFLGPVLVVSSTSDIKSINDLNGKHIGIITGSRPIISLYKNSSIDFVFYDYNNFSKLIDDVSNKVIDGMILNMIPAYEYTGSSLYRDRLKIVSGPLTKEGLRLIAKKSPESETLIEQFNEGLKTLKKDGVYSQLLLKWNLFNPDKP